MNDAEFLTHQIELKPTVTLKELQGVVENVRYKRVTLPTIRNALKRANYTLKSVGCVPEDRNCDRVIDLRYRHI